MIDKVNQWKRPDQSKPMEETKVNQWKRLYISIYTYINTIFW